eukprot:TRINITY_DN377_c0_g1_i13.p1 TRINITY_DN377_c0_g1~~TRINITY_DN377_c0_g1_i13.p1  ORF type:complete len:1237 (-),score=383.23 TRINITY_DN377_c0_g1_i13:158-3868(-)
MASKTDSDRESIQMLLQVQREVKALRASLLLGEEDMSEEARKNVEMILRRTENDLRQRTDRLLQSQFRGATHAGHLDRVSGDMRRTAAIGGKAYVDDLADVWEEDGKTSGLVEMEKRKAEEMEKHPAVLFERVRRSSKLVMPRGTGRRGGPRGKHIRGKTTRPGPVRRRLKVDDYYEQRERGLSGTEPEFELTGADIQRGLLDLVNRGIIAKNVDLSLAFSGNDGSWGPETMSAPYSDPGEPPINYPVATEADSMEEAPPYPMDLRRRDTPSDASVSLTSGKHEEGSKIQRIKRGSVLPQRHQHEHEQSRMTEFPTREIAMELERQKTQASGEGELSDLIQRKPRVSSSKDSEEDGDVSSSSSSSSSLGRHGDKDRKEVTRPPSKGMLSPMQPSAPPRAPSPKSYGQLLDQYSLHHFIIRRGKTITTAPEFMSYKRTYQSLWSSIAHVIRAMEQMAVDYNIILMNVDGKRVAEVAQDEFTRHTVEVLLSCVVNAHEVREALSQPGRRFRGTEAEHKAASRIQSAFRMSVCKNRYKYEVARDRAARKIQDQFRVFDGHKKMRVRLEGLAKEEEDEWREIQKNFIKSWSETKKAPRVEVHIPSFSLDEFQRKTLPELRKLQFSQFNRVLSIHSDPNVDVLLLSPIEVDEGAMKYFTSILEKDMGPEDIRRRVRIMYPEHGNKYPASMSLSQIILFNARLMNRIRNYVRGRRAYIVPQIVGAEDIRLAAKLKLPILGPDANLSVLYGSKSGSKRIFGLADVNMPIGAYDLYDRGEVVSVLAKLISQHPSFERWVIKIDNEIFGRGFAFLPVSYLISLERYVDIVGENALEEDGENEDNGDIDVDQSLQDLLKGSMSGKQKEGESMEKVDGQLEKKSISAEEKRRLKGELEQDLRQELDVRLEELLDIADKVTFPTSERFMQAFERNGGVIECVPSLRLGSPSVDFRIFPDGEVHFYGAYDQVVNDRLSVLAYSFPQKTVPCISLRDACASIARVCLRKGIIGFVTVDFVAFPDTRGGLRVWAVDLNFSQSMAHSHFQCFDMCCGGGFVPEEGLYVIPHEVLDLNEMEDDGQDDGDDMDMDMDMDMDVDEYKDEDAFVRRALGRGARREPRVRDDEGTRTLHLERASRSFLATPLLRHPFLSFIQHASFFADCKSFGYSVDLETAQGMIFIVVGSLLSGMLGISSFGKSQQENGMRMLKVLQFLFQEIGNEMSRDSEVLPGESNLETVMETVQQLVKRIS